MNLSRFVPQAAGASDRATQGFDKMMTLAPLVLSGAATPDQVALFSFISQNVSINYF
jgi:hypothetical protein